MNNKNEVVSSGWKLLNISELVDFNPENIGKNYQYKDIYYLDISSVGTGIADFSNTLDITVAPSRAKRIVRQNDTILATVRPVNRSFYFFNKFPENTVVSTGFAVLRAKLNLINSRFLYYVISNESFTSFLVANEQGANYPAVTPEIIGRAEVLLPPLSTQKRIASILSAYDDLIENNLKRIKLLEEIAQRTYEEWFVKFRINGEQLTIHEKTGLPVGWEKKKFKDVLNFVTGKLDSNALTVNGKYEFYTCSKEVYKTDSYCFYGEAVLLGGNNATGDFSLFYANTKFDAYQRTYIVTAKNESISLVYIFFVLKYYLPHFQNVSSGSATKFLTMKILDSTDILMPKDSILKIYTELAKPTFASIVNLKLQNQKLKESRDILLPKLMNGTLNIAS